MLISVSYIDHSVTIQSLEDDAAFKLWVFYYVTTERFDRDVCTGPMFEDCAMPETSEQRTAIYKHAAFVLRGIEEAAQRLKISSAQWREAKAAALRYSFDEQVQLYERMIR